MKTLDRNSIAESIQRGLNQDYIGEDFNGKSIAGFEVEILDQEYRTNWGGGNYDEIRINIILQGRGGKTKRRLYL